jgi:hypothetical protein
VTGLSAAAMAKDLRVSPAAVFQVAFSVSAKACSRQPTIQILDLPSFTQKSWKVEFPLHSGLEPVINFA